MMNKLLPPHLDSMGEIVAGCIAPHPPHVVYADNPPENEPHSEGGWETLRWGYAKLANKLKTLDYDALVIFTPHWQTYIGTHFLGLPHFKSKSVDPVFPNLFQFNYDLGVDVELSRALHDATKEAGMVTMMMENQDFRIDYGTIVSAHMLNRDWDKPIVPISSNRSRHYYSVEVMNEQARALGRACRKAILESDKRVVLVSTHSLSHRHFTTEPPIPEDMSKQHIYNHSNYVWDMKLIDLMREGKMQEVIDLMPEFTEQTMAETDSGSISWMMEALGMPDYPAEIYGYQSVIGTGNVVAAWDPNPETREVVL